MRQLEDELGVKLLEPNHPRRVGLIGEAGHAFQAYQLRIEPY